MKDKHEMKMNTTASSQSYEQKYVTNYYCRLGYHWLISVQFSIVLCNNQELLS